MTDMRSRNVSLTAVIILAAIIIPASAEQLRWNSPNNKTLSFKDKATGEEVGSAFVTGNRVYMRDRHGKHYATVIKEPDGTMKWLDPQGNPIDPKTTMVPFN
jgi:hypothetical protein